MSDAKKSQLADAKRLRLSPTNRLVVARGKGTGLGSVFGIPVEAIFVGAAALAAIAVWRRFHR